MSISHILYTFMCLSMSIQIGSFWCAYCILYNNMYTQRRQAVHIYICICIQADARTSVCKHYINKGTHIPIIIFLAPKGRGSWSRRGFFFFVLFSYMHLYAQNVFLCPHTHIVQCGYLTYFLPIIIYYNVYIIHYIDNIHR